MPVQLLNYFFLDFFFPDNSFTWFKNIIPSLRLIRQNISSSVVKRLGWGDLGSLFHFLGSSSQEKLYPGVWGEPISFTFAAGAGQRLTHTLQRKEWPLESISCTAHACTTIINKHGSLKDQFKTIKKEKESASCGLCKLSLSPRLVLTDPNYFHLIPDHFSFIYFTVW